MEHSRGVKLPGLVPRAHAGVLVLLGEGGQGCHIGGGRPVNSVKHCRQKQPIIHVSHTMINQAKLDSSFFYFQEVVFLNVIIKGSLCMFNSDIHVQCINETYKNIFKM